MRRDTEPAGFAEAWEAYPRRVGTNGRRDAARAYAARIADGVDPAALLAGVQRYAAFCTAQGQIGTPFVMQAQRFFGPSQHYAEPWPIPPASDDVSWDAVTLPEEAA